MPKIQATCQSRTQSEIGSLLDRQSEAIRMKDIDRLMSFHSSGIIYFDVVPPLQFAGPAALRGRFLDWFDGFAGPINMELRELNVLADEDFAVAYRLSRARGTLKNGQEVGRWVRATSCCQRANDTWLIAHEHISMPVDLRSGKAAMELAP